MKIYRNQSGVGQGAGWRQVVVSCLGMVSDVVSRSNQTRVIVLYTLPVLPHFRFEVACIRGLYGHVRLGFNVHLGTVIPYTSSGC